MIVTDQKPDREVLDAVKDYRTVFIIGCGSCATASRTGGEEECRAWADKLRDSGTVAAGYLVPQETCHVLLMKSMIRQSEEALSSDALLVLACGAGVQAVSAAADKPVVAGLNSMFLGTTYRAGEFLRYCSMCGTCVLSRTAGICPVTRCPKGLLNGPCGGMVGGMCEVDSAMECVWVTIHDRLKARGDQRELLRMNAPRNYVSAKHRRVVPANISRKSPSRDVQ
ncbi:MAG: methylenetetrahydrofolate reductase C-terminal domain-containing protein [Deltaproteobacteria bacterium]|nr:methylenetetrahydrofolate reductase C-terminal domain-containing protein [Deltaproteobacteria bacterium]MCL5276939.1 methylenetetrahydrofolate reductase C-terminal domain-containing protein [Deltaproteobacteria bacterium]